MHALGAAGILAVWEAGSSQHPLDRALTLLAAAAPELGRAELAALEIGERDRRLLELRERTFGPALESVAACPACGEQIEFQFNVADACRPRPAPRKGALGLAADGWRWTARLPDTLDLAAIAAAPDRPAARRALLERCVTEAWRAGTRVAAQDMPEDAIAMLDACLAEADPQAASNVAVECPACGARAELAFDIAVYLWTEIAAEARRLLRDVDALARAYGWSEGEILALSPARREAYLELVRA